MSAHSSSLPDLAVVYEHPQWFEPLFEALERRGLSYVKVPLAGHVFDPAVAKALEELKDNAAFFKVLGSYPVSLSF